MYTVRRTPHNPILVPNHSRQWEAFAAFNMCPVRDADNPRKIYGVYRAISAPDPLRTPQQISTIAIADSVDGIHFENHRELLTPVESWERYGCEDPRVTYFEGQYYIFYTALSTYPYGADGIKVAVAISPDLKTITERHLVTPFNAKAMALFPSRINGKITVVFSAHTDMPPAKITIAQVDDIEELWSPFFWAKWHADIDSYTIADPRRSPYDHIEVGAPPVRTDRGWLFIYSHIQNYFSNPEHFERIFGIEALLLDMANPRKIVGHTFGAILAPEELYELKGDVANVIFPSGALIHKSVGRKHDDLIIYYGAADTTTCSAQVPIEDLLASIDPATSVDQYFQRPLSVPLLLPIHAGSNASENSLIGSIKLNEDKKHAWEAKAVFNPAAIKLRGDNGVEKIYLLYRAMSEDNTSVVGCAVLDADGVTVVERFPDPVYVPREPFEMKRVPGGNSGCEDPRLTRIGDRVYMCYTAYNGIDVPRVAVSSISVGDFLARRWFGAEDASGTIPTGWTKPVLISPPGIDDKDACIFPEKFGVSKAAVAKDDSGGKWFLLHRIGTEICGDYVDSLDFTDNQINRCIPVLAPRPGKWDSAKVGLSVPPIKTVHGWLLLYHGISRQHHTYRVGAVLLDLEDPTLVLARSADALFEPQESYEKKGIVDIVVFPCGAIVREDKKAGDDLLIYYGGADSVVGVACMKLEIIVGGLERGVERMH